MSTPDENTPRENDEPTGTPPRSFLMIWFRCCNAYGRLTKTPDGTQYKGRCPKCRREAQARVGEGGSNRRMFEAE
ncbi:MAG: hypothetical protein EXS10_08455 [Phycisphaerales bacterium]|nr:hypothetical protein [Phycisphaerales bacterium]